MLCPTLIDIVNLRLTFLRRGEKNDLIAPTALALGGTFSGGVDAFGED